MAATEGFRRRTLGISMLVAIVTLAAALGGAAGFATTGNTELQAAPELPFIAAYRANRNIAESIELAGGTLLANLPEINVVIASGSESFQVQLQQNSNFEYVVRDELIDWLENTRARPPSMFERRVTAHVVQNPRLALFLDDQWNIRNVLADLAWDITEGDPEIKVAVLDTGICTHHPDLADKVDTAFSRSFVIPFFEVADTVAPACIGCPAWEDRNYHGTHVASIISSNNLGTASVAPRVRLRAVKVLNSEGHGTFGWTILGLLYAANTGNHIISMSLGGLLARGFPVPPDPRNGNIPIPLGRTLLIRTLAQAVTYAREHGSLVIASAGNEGHNLDGADDGVSLPCEAASGMCIGATTISDARADYSNYGRSLVQLMAPGGGEPVTPFPPTDENTAVLGPCSEHSVELPACGGTHAYIFVSGTSQAVPHVSGAAALIASLLRRQVGSNPGLWQRALVSTAEDIGPRGVDNEFSHGRLDVLRALQRAGRE